VSLLGDHDPRGEEEAVEGHASDAVLLLAPLSGEVRVASLRVSETGTGDELDVRVLTDRGVGGEDGGVEVLARVVTTGASTGPLEDDGEVGVVGGDVDDLTDTVDRSYARESKSVRKKGRRGRRR
jgi:hypothetical protein